VPLLPLLLLLLVPLLLLVLLPPLLVAFKRVKTVL
jgi:hypothetical protein